MSELDAILGESREAAIRREQATFDRIAAPFQREIVLFGAGNLGRKALVALRKTGVEPLAFSDNNSRTWGTEIDGIPVLAPRDAIAKYGDKSTFVMTIWRGEGSDRMPDRIAALRAAGAGRVISFGSLFWKHAAELLPHYALNLPHRVIEQAEQVREAFALFEDEASRREYLAQVKWRAVLDFDGLPNPVSHEIYFPTDLFAIRRDECFIDCGAFDGDTIRRFYANRPDFEGQIKAFEPDPKNYAKLNSFVAGSGQAHRIETFDCAISNERKTVKFSGTGNSAAAVGTGELEVEAVPLDEVLAHCTPTYIKMDTEGSELDGLTGARNILAKEAPALAICVYHRQDHLWKIPLEVKKHAVEGEYSFYLRPHVFDVWDLVMYAVPKWRA